MVLARLFCGFLPCLLLAVQFLFFLLAIPARYTDSYFKNLYIEGLGFGAIARCGTGILEFS